MFFHFTFTGIVAYKNKIQMFCKTMISYLKNKTPEIALRGCLQAKS